MNTCPDCGKPLYPDAVHTCSPQTLAEALKRYGGDLVSHPVSRGIDDIETAGCLMLEAVRRIKKLEAENEALKQALHMEEAISFRRQLHEVQAENEALREAINKFVSEELTVGQRYTNAGQGLLDALARAGEVE